MKKTWQPTQEWFWSRVDKRGPKIPYVWGRCWVWNRYLNSTSGYGMVRPTTARGQKEFATLTAHRVAWELVYVPIPAGVLVLHRCDNRACVRPSHLFLGDDKANSEDMKQKGRERKAHGEEQHLAKLTARKVRQIRKERKKTLPTPLKRLAKRHDVSMVAVSWAATGKTWAHVSEPPVKAAQRGMSRNQHGRFS